MRNIIWTNDLTERLDILDNDPACADWSDAQRFEEAQLMAEADFNAEMAILDIETDGDIIAFADMARWNGVFPAVKDVESNKIAHCLHTAAEGEHVTVFYEDGELKAEWYGHDNPVTPTLITFRAMNKDTDWMDKNDAMYGYRGDRENRWKIPDKLTHPIGDKVAEVYGWN